MATVTLARVSKAFKGARGQIHAVDDLDLAVGDGEFLVLAGPSGCGKTTTLRLIAGLEEATTGTIQIGERDVTRAAPRDRDVAMVFQDYALYPHMTVFKNMAFGLKMRGTPTDEIKRRVDEAACTLGIEHLLDRRPAALSGGERQRVALGRAIVREPQVFLFDEPLSNLDARLRVHMRTEIKGLHCDLMTTMIYVTHDQEEAMTLGDRIAVMREGAIQQCGTPLEVYNRPTSRFVAGFIGTPSMNFLSGHLEGEREAVVFVTDAGRLPLPPDAGADLPGCYGKELVLGIRPEHLRPNGADSAPTEYRSADRRDGITTGIEATVRVVEPLGDCAHVHLTASSGTRLVTRVPPGITATPGQHVRLFFDLSHAHFFTTDSEGRRLN